MIISTAIFFKMKEMGAELPSRYSSYRDMGGSWIAPFVSVQNKWNSFEAPAAKELF